MVRVSRCVCPFESASESCVQGAAEPYFCGLARTLKNLDLYGGMSLA